MNLWFRCFLLLLLYVPLLPAQSPLPPEGLFPPLHLPARPVLHSAKTHALWTPPNCLTLNWSAGWDSSTVNYYQYSPAGELLLDSLCTWSAAGWQPLQMHRCTWDVLGYMDSRTDYEYDTAGFYPTLRQEVEYDSAGNPTWSLLARFNRFTGVWDTLSAQEAVISYGPTGKPLAAMYYVLNPPAHTWSHTGRVLMGYDAQDRVISQTQESYSGGNYLPQLRILWTYGPGGDLESRTEQSHPDTSWVNTTRLHWLSWHDAALQQADSMWVLRWDTLAWDTTEFYRYTWFPYNSYDYTRYMETDSGRVNFKLERARFDAHDYTLLEETYVWDVSAWEYSQAAHHTVLYGMDGYPQVDSVASIPLLSLLSSPVPYRKRIYGASMVSVSPPAAPAVLQAWPNPTTGPLAVNLPAHAVPASLTLTNALGQTVRRWETAAERLDTDLAGLPPGVYVLSAGAAGHSVHTRIVVH